MIQITILYTGDIHARVDQFLRLAYIAQLQRYDLNAVGRYVIQVDAGDVEDRALIESDLSKGAAMFQLLKAAGYDVSALGNGAALPYGIQVLENIATTSGLPLLCANLLTRDPQPVPVPGLLPAIIMQCGPMRVGLTGLTADFNGAYEQFFSVSTPDAIETARAQAQKLRDQGCQLVGVLSHLGYELDVQLAKALPDLNFIIGGHSHTVLRYPVEVGSVLICHAGSYAEYLGRLDLTIDDEGQIVKHHGQLIPIPEDGPQHQPTAQVWQDIQAKTQIKLSETVGHLSAAVDLAGDRACGMGQLLADALRAHMSTDVAFCITGHLFSGLPAGPVTLGDLVRASRSSANPGATRLTGAQIVHALEHGADPKVWQQTPTALRGAAIGILQVSGLTYRLDHTAPEGQRVSDVRVLGRPIDPTEVYGVASTDYELLAPREYIPGLEFSAVRFDTPWVVREVLQNYLSTFSPLTPGERPRITIPEGGSNPYVGPVVRPVLPADK